MKPEQRSQTDALFVALLLSFPGLGWAAQAAEADGVAASIFTNQGEAMSGKFLGATGTALTVEVRGRRITLPLVEISYVSFGGHPVSASYAKPATRAIELRMEGALVENAGRLDDALRKYEEAKTADPSDPATEKALQRVREKIATREAGKKAAPYKKLALDLRESRRYHEAAACYEEAIRVDPYDLEFKESLAPLRHYWEPTTCPTAPKQ